MYLQQSSQAMQLRSRRVLTVVVLVLPIAVIVVASYGLHQWPRRDGRSQNPGFDVAADECSLDSEFSNEDHERVRNIISQFVASPSTSLSHRLHRWRVWLAMECKYKAELLRETEAVFSVSWADVDASFLQSPFIRTPHGPALRRYDEKYKRTGILYESHVDEFLAACADSGIDANQTIQTNTGLIKVKDLVEASRSRFVIDQPLEWSAVAYMAYKPGESTWVNRFGHECSYDAMLSRLMETSTVESPCFGTHTPLVVTLALNADDRYGFLRHSTREKASQYLMRVSRSLQTHQLASGAWNRTWLNGRLAEKSNDMDIDELLVGPCNSFCVRRAGNVICY